MNSNFLIISLVSRHVGFLINSLCNYRKTVSVPNVVDLSSNFERPPSDCCSGSFVFEVWQLERQLGKGGDTL